MKVKEIAKICHQASKAYCEANQDFSQSNWEDADDNIKASVIKGAQYFIDNPENNSPMAMHDAWTEAKLDDGWVYGEVKDAKVKEHPNLVEYSELPEVQRKKDELFSAICAVCLHGDEDDEELDEDDEELDEDDEDNE